MEKAGWICRKSKSYPDRVYWFNMLTGASSWEKPDVKQGEPSFPVVLASSNHPAQSPDGKRVVIERTAEFSPVNSDEETDSESPTVNLSASRAAKQRCNHLYVSPSKKQIKNDFQPVIRRTTSKSKSSRGEPRDRDRAVASSTIGIAKGPVARRISDKFDTPEKSRPHKKRAVRNSAEDKILVTVIGDGSDVDSPVIPIKFMNSDKTAVKRKNLEVTSTTDGGVEKGSIRDRLGKQLKDSETGSRKKIKKCDPSSDSKTGKWCRDSVIIIGDSDEGETGKIQSKTSDIKETNTAKRSLSVRADEGVKHLDNRLSLGTKVNDTAEQHTKWGKLSNIQSTLKHQPLVQDKRVVLSSDLTSSARKDIVTPVQTESETPKVKNSIKDRLGLGAVSAPNYIAHFSVSEKKGAPALAEQPTAKKRKKKKKKKQSAATKLINNYSALTFNTNTGSQLNTSGGKKTSIDSAVVHRLYSSSQDVRLVVPASANSNPKNFARKFTERGWPGMNKATTTNSGQSREITEMEVDDITLPEYETQPEDMVVDLLAEVRQHVTSQPQSQNTGGWFDGEEQSEYVTPNTQNDKNDQGLFVVLDTNVLISDLSFITDFKDDSITGYGKPVLVIPWIVLQELDTLKTGHKSTLSNLSLGTQMKARKGISFLQSCFKNQLLRIVGQTPKQAMEAASEFSASNNDDRIIQACLQCQKNNSRSHIVLMTNDNNLITKSLVCGVTAFTRTGIMTGLRKAKKVKMKSHQKETPSVVVTNTGPQTPVGTSTGDASSSSCNLNRTRLPIEGVTTGLPSQGVTGLTSLGVIQSANPSLLTDSSPCVPYKSQRSPQPQTQLPSPSARPIVAIATKEDKSESSVPKENDTYKLEVLVDEIYGKLKKLLREALGKALETEMRLAYDDIWEEIVYRKPPWSLADILESMKKHWIAVFGMVLYRPLLKSVQKLINLFHINSEVTLELLIETTKESSLLLQDCVKRNKYGPTMQQITRCVTCLGELCKDLSENKIAVPSVDSLEPYLSKHLDSPADLVVKHSMTTINNNHIKDSYNSPPQSQEQKDDPPVNVISPTVNQPAQPTINNPAVLIERSRNKLQKIWEQIYKYCQDLGGVMENLDKITSDILSNVQFLLHKLVPVVKQIRIQLAKMLELPSSEVGDHEMEFYTFSYHCQTFFKDLHSVDEFPEVDEKYFLAIFEDTTQRDSLTVFLKQLDEMLCHLYRCVSHLANSGLG